MGLPDTLRGGDEDIVIGGFTVYDYDAGGELSAILAVWADPILKYPERVDYLYSSYLNEGTVFSNYAGNTLFGEGERDFFFGNPDWDLTDWDPNSEVFLLVF